MRDASKDLRFDRGQRANNHRTLVARVQATIRWEPHVRESRLSSEDHELRPDRHVRSRGRRGSMRIDQ